MHHDIGVLLLLTVALLVHGVLVLKMPLGDAGVALLFTIELPVSEKQRKARSRQSVETSCCAPSRYPSTQCSSQTCDGKTSEPCSCSRDPALLLVLVSTTPVPTPAPPDWRKQDHRMIQRSSARSLWYFLGGGLGIEPKHDRKLYCKYAVPHRVPRWRKRGGGG